MALVGRNTRRFGPLFLIVALALGLLGALAPATGAQAANPATVRNRIKNLALGEINKHERRGNYYPIEYKVNRDIIRPAEWCGVFAHWAWYRGGATRIPNMAGRGVNQGHWATYWQKWGKNNHRWKPIGQRNVSYGDAVVYGNFPQTGHIGIVVAVRYDSHNRATAVRTVEGNLSDKVKDTGWRSITRLTGAGKAATGFVSPV